MNSNFNYLYRFSIKLGMTTFDTDYVRLIPKSNLLEFKKVLNESPFGIGKHFNAIAKTLCTHIVKARFFCKNLKKKNLRIIYSYFELEQRIEFIELYFKGKTKLAKG